MYITFEHLFIGTCRNCSCFKYVRIIFCHSFFMQKKTCTASRHKKKQPTTSPNNFTPFSCSPPWAAAVVTGAGDSPSTAPCARFQNRCSDAPPAFPRLPFPPGKVGDGGHQNPREVCFFGWVGVQGKQNRLDGSAKPRGFREKQH